MDLSPYEIDNLEAIEKKILMDLYSEFGTGIFEVIETRLSVLSNPNQPDSPLDLLFLQSPNQTYLFSEIQVLDQKQNKVISLLEYMTNTVSIPETVLNKGVQKPLVGLIELLAVAKILGDKIAIGNGNNNVSVQWSGDENTEMASIVKIGPSLHSVEKGVIGNIFSFFGSRSDPKDLEIIGENQKKIIIPFTKLTLSQRDTFLMVLLHCQRYLDEQVFEYLFFRDNLFNHNHLNQNFEYLPPEISKLIANGMRETIKRQLDIYQEEIKSFEMRYPENSLRSYYLDQYSQLKLPMSDETVLMSDLLIEFTLVDGENPLKLTELFAEKGNQFKRVSLLGAAGVGNHTLCQKIAHDWASNSLFDQFKAVYWIPLYLLNSHVAEQGSFLSSAKDPNTLIAYVMTHIILNRPDLFDAFFKQIQRDQQKILILLDGYDEAQGTLRKILIPLFENNGFHLLLTSRSEAYQDTKYIERRVENKGFSNQCIDTYVNRFFTKKENGEVGKFEAQNFLLGLKANASLFSIAHHPLFLQMFCTMWEQGGSKQVDFGSNLTQLYGNLVEELYRWQFLHKEINQDPAYKLKLFALLGQIANKGLLSEKQMIPRADVLPLIEIQEVTEQQLIDTGLLELAGSGVNTHYCFLHPNFQCYLVGRYISFLSQEEQKIFIMANRDNPHYESSLIFLIGAIFARDISLDKAESKAFFNHLLFNYPELSESFLQLLIRCLNECPTYDQSIPELEQILFQEPVKNSEPLNRNLFIGIWTADHRLFHALKWLYSKCSTLILQQDKKERTVLHLLAEKGHVEDLEKLRSLCIKIENQQKCYWEILLKIPNKDLEKAAYVAAKHGHIDALIWLNKASELISNEKSKDKEPDWFYAAHHITVVHAAAQGGHLGVLEQLCSDFPDSFQKIDDSGRTVLHAAAEGGNVQVLDWLCTKYPDLINKVDKRERTVLYWAARGGHLDAVKYLFSQDKDLLKKRDKSGRTVLHAAAQGGSTECLDWLFTKKPQFFKLVDKWKKSVLHVAAEEGNIQAFDWCCEQIIDPAQRKESMIKKDKNERTLLHAAAVGGAIPILDQLCHQYPEFLTQVDADGRTVLHAAAEGGDLQAFIRLYKKDKELLNQVDRQKRTVGHIAAQNGHTNILKWLNKHHPRFFHLVDKYGRTIGHSAAEGGHVKVLQWLDKKHPSLFNIMDRSERTLMNAAAEQSYLQAMQWLFEKDNQLIKKKKNVPIIDSVIVHFDQNNHLAILEEGLYPKTGPERNPKKAIQWLYLLNLETDRPLAQKEALMLGAARNGSLEMMKWLYEEDQNLIKAIADDGGNLMHEAIARKNCTYETQDSYQLIQKTIDWLCQMDKEMIDATDGKKRTAEALGRELNRGIKWPKKPEKRSFNTIEVEEPPHKKKA